MEKFVVSKVIRYKNFFLYQEEHLEKRGWLESEREEGAFREEGMIRRGRAFREEGWLERKEWLEEEKWLERRG